ncbi:MAG: HPr kinase/phosphorylase [Beijerinckiaceae bacterium]
MQSTTIHGVAIAVGDIGILIRGKSGAGKSGLAAAMIAHWPFGAVRLVADDRVCLTVHGQRLVARAHPAISGQIELRGYGIQAVPALESIVLRGCIDVLDAKPDRLPLPEARKASVMGVSLPVMPLSGDYSLLGQFVTVWPYFRDELMIV